MTTLPTNQIILGDCLEEMAKWPDQCIQTCVTSPPYWGLRDYGTATWEGGDVNCDHVDAKQLKRSLRVNASQQRQGRTASASKLSDGARAVQTRCECGARRVDQQLGLEKTPEEYVAKMVEVFRGVWRVLRDDGTLWLNLGDSYAQANGSGPQGKSQCERPSNNIKHNRDRKQQLGGTLKPKDLCGIPWRVALALQADGWYLRQDIIWAKPNPMPESVTDRCTKAHEYIFLLTKKPRYFYDAEAVKEPAESNRPDMALKGIRTGKAYLQQGIIADNTLAKCDRKTVYSRDLDVSTADVSNRNKRSVWTVTTHSFKEAHFATFPPKLIEPCILAGTSAKGACPECGAPWARVVEKTKTFESGSGKSGNPIAGKQDLSASETNSTPDIRMGPVVSFKTTGWRPTCKCGSTRDERRWTKPCVVFDPFMGAGTTAMVAIQHGRDYVGTELSPEYAKIAQRRIDAVVTGVPIKEADNGQMAMFSEQS